MTNIEEAVKMITGETPSAKWTEKINKIAFLLNLKKGDPIFDLLLLLDAESGLISKNIEKGRQIRETELVVCEKRMALVAAEMKGKMVSEVVPQVSERVAIAASEQISRMSVQIGLWRVVLMLCAAVAALVFVFATGFFIAKAIPLLDFLRHVNTSIYTMNTVIEVSVSRIGAALFPACMILGCLGFSTCVTLWSKDDSTVFWTWCITAIATMFCIMLAWTFFMTSPKIQIISDKSAVSALFSAARGTTKPEFIKELLSAKISVNVTDDDGITPLMFAAAENQNPEIIKTLVGLGANVNAKDKDGNTALMLALSGNSNPDVATVLINLSADVNAKRKGGENPIFFAVRDGGGSPNLVSELIKAGAGVNEKYGEEQITLLMAAARAAKTPEIISLLIKSGAKVNEKSEKGKTALTYAADYTSNPEVVRVLINAKADINAMDRNGNTALDLARQNRALSNSDVIRLLKPTSRK